MENVLEGWASRRKVGLAVRQNEVCSGIFVMGNENDAKVW